MPSVDSYERHSRGYAEHRRADPRIAARIHAALGDARTVLNVGAGAGRSAQSLWTLLPPGEEDRIVARLATALADGSWDSEHGHLRRLDRFDGALRLVVSEPDPV